MAEQPRYEFEWDLVKERINIRAHKGVTFNEAATVFADPYASLLYDPAHSEAEHREIIIGYSNRNRLLLVSFTEKGINLIRIISARRITPKERERYEKEPD